MEKESIYLSFLVRRRWPKLGCFENNICTLSTFEVVPSTFYDGSEEDPKKCFTAFNENDCPNVEGKVAVNGTERDQFCFKEMCLEGEFKFMEPKHIYKQTCDDDFERVEGLGCVKYFEEENNYCAAREKCLQEGADLMSYGEDPNPLKTFMEEKGIEENVHVGLERRGEGAAFKWS